MSNDKDITDRTLKLLSLWNNYTSLSDQGRHQEAYAMFYLFKTQGVNLVKQYGNDVVKPYFEKYLVTPTDRLRKDKLKYGPIRLLLGDGCIDWSWKI